MYIYIHVSLCLFQPAILSDWHCQEALDIQKKIRHKQIKLEFKNYQTLLISTALGFTKKISSKQIEIEIEIDW